MATVIELESGVDLLLISRHKTFTTMYFLQHVPSVYWYCDTKWSTITVKNILLILWHFAEIVVSWATICFPAGESKVEADYLTSMVWSPHTKIWRNLIHQLIPFFWFCKRESRMTSRLHPTISSPLMSILLLSCANFAAPFVGREYFRVFTCRFKLISAGWVHS